jgi:hypothetical protein
MYIKDGNSVSLQLKVPKDFDEDITKMSQILGMKRNDLIRLSIENTLQFLPKSIDLSQKEINWNDHSPRNLKILQDEYERRKEAFREAHEALKKFQK